MLKNLFGTKKPKEKYSLENLKYLYATLAREPVITNSNKARVVEVVRSIAEVVIYGEQNQQAAVFDYFAEVNMLANFVKILAQRCDNKVKVQIIQTLSLLIQNLTNEVSVFYILSNNYINDLIVHRFDFADEDIVDHYINFLKSLSFKLNTRTIFFFFNEQAQDFPLLNEAIKFCNHPEKMVRVAVRTISLNIFRINDLSLRKYILTKTAVPYFSHLVWFLRDQTVELDKAIHAPHMTLARLDAQVEYLLDQLYFIQDVITCGDGFEQDVGSSNHHDDSAAPTHAEPSSVSVGREHTGLHFQHLISEILVDQLLGYYILPLIIGSLVPAQSKIPAHLLISTRLSFFMLNQIFAIFSNHALVNTILSILVKKEIAPLTLRMIQEAPRGPIRNSDGSPLTDLLYPKSASLRRANVEPELQLLVAEPVARRRSTRGSSTSAASILATPKPTRTNATPFETPASSPTPSQSPGGTESPAPSATIKSPSGSETELQTITPTKPTESERSATAAADSTFVNAAPLDASTTDDLVSTASATSSEVVTAPTTPPTTSTVAALADLPGAMPTELPPPAVVSPPPADGWKCVQCTYINPSTYLTCSICQCVRPPSPGLDNSTAGADPVMPTDPLSPVIANAGLASAYLTPVKANGTTSALASPAATPSKTPNSREIPVDENSKARSKLPEVGPLYSPIDHFGAVVSSEPTPAAAAAAAAAANPSTSTPLTSSPGSASPSSKTTVPGMTAQSVQLDSRLLNESESNDYQAALLRYLEWAQVEVASAPPSVMSPLHVEGAPLRVDDRGVLDERDLYGSLSVLYAFFMIRPECLDVDLLLQSNLCSQAHRKTGRLLADLMANSSTKDLLGLTGTPTANERNTSSQSRSRNGTTIAATDLLFSSPIVDKLEDEFPLVVTAATARNGATSNEPLSTSHSKDAISPLDALKSEPDQLESQPDLPSATRPDASEHIESSASAADSSPESTNDPLLQKSAHPLVASTTPLRSPLPKSRSGSQSSASGSMPKISSLAIDALAQSKEENPATSLRKENLDESPRGVYNRELVTQLLNLFNHHPPYRLVTLQAMLEVLKEMVIVPPPANLPSSATSSSTSAKGISCLQSEHDAQLDRLYAILVEDLRLKMLDPLRNLFVVDIVEEEYPHFATPDPTYGTAGRVAMARIRSSAQHLLPIDVGYVKETPMEFRVQSSGLMSREQVSSLLAATGVSPSPQPLTQIVTMNEVERLRKAVQVLLMLRNLKLKVAYQRDTLFYPLPLATPLPPPANTSPALQHPQTQLFREPTLRLSQEIFTAHHPDAMLCTLQIEAKKKAHLFFVIDEWDCILVELQQNKPGTAIVQLRQSLRHVEAFQNRNNACLLHVTFRSAQRPHLAARRLTYPNEAAFKPLWVISMLFLDAIQCARAWKHLDTRRTAIRKDILGKLCNELTLPLDESQLQAIASACTTIQAYPSVEFDVHTDSLLFGIPNPPIPATSLPTGSMAPAQSATAAATASAVTPPTSVPASAITVPIPVAQPVAPSPRAATGHAAPAAPAAPVDGAVSTVPAP